jgi:hypothetical protein
MRPSENCSRTGLVWCRLRAKGRVPGELARRLRPTRPERVPLEGLRHIARTAFINAPPREQRLVVLHYQHIPARADVRVVAQLAGLHAAIAGMPQAPHLLAGLPLARNVDAMMSRAYQGMSSVGAASAIAPDSTGRR